MIHRANIWSVKNREPDSLSTKQNLVVRFALTLPDPKMPPRITSHIFGGPIHAAI